MARKRKKRGYAFRSAKGEVMIKMDAKDGLREGHTLIIGYPELIELLQGQGITGIRGIRFDESGLNVYRLAPELLGRRKLGTDWIATKPQKEKTPA